MTEDLAARSNPVRFVLMRWFSGLLRRFHRLAMTGREANKQPQPKWLGLFVCTGTEGNSTPTREAGDEVIALPFRHWRRKRRSLGRRPSLNSLNSLNSLTRKRHRKARGSGKVIALPLRHCEGFSLFP